MLFQTCKTFWSSIECNATEMFPDPEMYKNIGKIVHVTSVAQL